MKVFYVNIGGGEPMLRPDFFDLRRLRRRAKVGVKFSTNGTRLTADRARRLAAMDYVDVQVSIDGALASTNDAVRGDGSFAAARTAMDNLAAADFGPVQDQRGRDPGERHPTRPVRRDRRGLRGPTPADPVPALGSGRRRHGRRLHPTAEQQRMLYHWLLERPDVLTGDSFFHLSALGQPLDGLNLCGAGQGGLPDRPGGRRLRLPVRHRQGVPGRQRPRRRRVRRCVAASPTLRVAARAAECGSLRLLRVLRRLPGGLHGGQVLHRPPARRARSRVRVRPRRGRAGGPRTRRPGPGAASATPRWTAAGRPSRCPPPSASGRQPAHNAARGVVDGGARRRHLAGGRRRRGARRCWPCPLGSLEQHGPHLPLDTDTRIAVELAARLWRPAVPMSWWRPPCPTGPAASTPAFPGTLLVDHDGAGRSAGRAGPLRPRLLRRRGRDLRPRGQPEALSLAEPAVPGRRRRGAGLDGRRRRAATPMPGGPRRR